MVRNQRNPIAYVLELVGSLVLMLLLIYTVYAFSAYTSTPGLFILQAAGGFWLPLAYATAVVATIALFVTSFTNLMQTRSNMNHKYPMLATLLAGFSWIGLSAGSASLAIVAIVGFTIALLGSAFGLHE